MIKYESRSTRPPEKQDASNRISPTTPQNSSENISKEENPLSNCPDDNKTKNPEKTNDSTCSTETDTVNESEEPYSTTSTTSPNPFYQSENTGILTYTTKTYTADNISCSQKYNATIDNNEYPSYSSNIDISTDKIEYYQQDTKTYKTEKLLLKPDDFFNEIISHDKVAQIFDVTARTIRTYAKKFNLSRYTIGKRTFFLKREIYQIFTDNKK